MYKLINFTEIASNALLHTLNDIHGDYIDFNKPNKEILSYYLNKLITEKCKFRYNKNIIFVETCSPIDNWRKSDRGRGIKGYKYSLSDNSIKMNIDKLNTYLTSFFKKIEKNHNNCYTIQHKNMDLSDLYFIISNYLGIDLIKYSHPPNYLIIKDANEYVYKSHIPDHLILEVENIMIEKCLI